MSNEKNYCIATSKKVQKVVLAMSHDINTIATAACVKPHFQTHWMKTNSNECGIEALISEIMKENQAAMSIVQVWQKIQEKFTEDSTRYGLQTIRNYMSIKMILNGKLIKIKLSKQDSDIFCNENNLPIAKKPCDIYKLDLLFKSIIWE